MHAIIRVGLLREMLVLAWAFEAAFGRHQRLSKRASGERAVAGLEAPRASYAHECGSGG